MAEHERATQNKQADIDQKHRIKQQDSEPLSSQIHDWGEGISSMTEYPFNPRMDEHAELLAQAASHSDVAVHNLVMQLHQTYGNRYVQRLLNSNVVQAKLTVNAPGDIYEQEADRIADEVISAEKSQVQRQEEEEEEEEEEVQTQRQEEEEEELQAQRQPVEEEEEEQVQFLRILKRVSTMRGAVVIPSRKMLENRWSMPLGLISAESACILIHKQTC